MVRILNYLCSLAPATMLIAGWIARLLGAMSTLFAVALGELGMTPKTEYRSRFAAGLLSSSNRPQWV